MLATLMAVLAGAPASSAAVEYTLAVANLHVEALNFFVPGPARGGTGQVAVPDLEQPLDAGRVPGGALLFDRDPTPARTTEALAFGAVPVTSIHHTGTGGGGNWTTIHWDGGPNQRSVWVIRGAASRQQVNRIALGRSGDLRYFIPYRAPLFPTPSPAVGYPLTFLRPSDDHRVLSFLSKAVNLDQGLAAVVGLDGIGGDWVYLIVVQPPQPATFKAVIGWDDLGVNDRNHIHGSSPRP
jgi:hypothetical protein